VHPFDLGLRRDARPVRKVPRRNYFMQFEGDGGDFKALGIAPFRSLLERDLRTLLSATPQVQDYAIESHVLTYFAPNGRGSLDRHTYIPDVVVRYKNGRLAIIDAKAVFFAKSPRWIFLKPFIEEAYRIDHSVDFGVLTEMDIRPQPRLSNCQIMLRHSYIVDDGEALYRVRQALNASVLPITIKQIQAIATLVSNTGSCRAFTAIMNLALIGEIELDLSKPFNRNTQIEWATI